MENKTHIFKALAEFQQEVPIIHKGTKGYGYSYADLATIYPVINPILAKHGLGFTQLVNGNNIDTIVFHVESGETLQSSTEIPQNVDLAKMNQFQVLGSAITYIRRYALSSILGIVTDKDTDASGEQKPNKALTEDEINNLFIKIDDTSDIKLLQKLYNSDNRYKINKDIVQAFKDRNRELTQS